MIGKSSSFLIRSRYLEEDPSTTALARRLPLQGYELYLVEQWACSRVHPTFVITTYTGLEEHFVLVNVLSVPTNEEAWSPRLRVYLKAITQFHARKKETPLGTLMVTNLSGFPSALTVIAVPDGDIFRHRADFIVNENLKRMGCSGRAGLQISPPISATQATFMRLYKTSDSVAIYSSVIELVKLCQVALILFKKLAPEYADGLLCDVTEQAINDWWSEIGTEFFNTDPTDGILGPTTVAALLGMLLGARNRLNAYGAPVAKDIFDLTSTKRGIASFQKSQKLERTRRFDRQTLKRLHKVTAKAVSGQGWTVPRAVKSTVAELSGKGSDIVMGMVGGREKVGIAEVETLDIETFVQLAYGERCKWLWHGKPLKSNELELFSTAISDDSMVSSVKGDSGVDENSRHGAPDRLCIIPSHGSQTNLESTNKEPAPRRTVLKSVTERMTDARSGLGRIKDAVGKSGFRGHHHKHSKDENLAFDGDSRRETPMNSQPRHSGDVWSAPLETKPKNANEGAAEYYLPSSRGGSVTDDSFNAKRGAQSAVLEDKSLETDADSISSIESESRNLGLEYHRLNRFQNIKNHGRNSTRSVDSLKAAGTQEHFGLRSRKLDWRKRFPLETDTPPLLRSTKSLSHMWTDPKTDFHKSRWPRHLSFSAVIDAVAAGTGTIGLSDVDAGKTVDAALVIEDNLAMNLRLLETRIQNLSARDGSWVEQRVADVKDFDTQYAKDQENLDQMYRLKVEEYQALRDASDELVGEEKRSLTEKIKEVDTLGAKLEYELTALQSKIKDVENGAAEFERQILEIEIKAEGLREETKDRDSWLSRAWSLFGGKTSQRTDT